jgi:hypothetical protein
LRELPALPAYLDDDWLGVEWGLMETNRLQYQREKHPWKGRVPDETDLLVTHTPPVGSSALLAWKTVH